MCGPGPVNLGGELTVRHSALLVVDDAHSCCYNLWWQIPQNNRQKKTSMTCHIFSSPAAPFRRPPPSIPVSLLQPFKSLDLSALLNVAERPSLAPEYCWKHKVLAGSGRFGASFASVKSSSYVLDQYTHAHPSYYRWSLPFRTKPAQYSHTTTLHISSVFMEIAPCI